MRRSRIPLLLLLLGLLGWGATETGLALGDRLWAGLGGDTPRSVEAGRSSDGADQGGAASSGTSDPSQDRARSVAMGSGRQRALGHPSGGSDSADAESGSGDATASTDGSPDPGRADRSAAEAARSASAAAFRRSMARLGARMGLTPDDLLATPVDRHGGAGDPFASPPLSRRDPSLEGPDAPGRGTPVKPAEPERIEVT